MFPVSDLDELNGAETDPRLKQLVKRLREVESHLQSQMRARGFDPEQSENLALTAPLARLFIEQETLRAELATLTEKKSARLLMTEVERIIDQSQRGFAGDAWHGPSLTKILEGVTASRPFSDAHRIWELVAHIAAWERAGVRRLGGDRADLSDEEDWPSIPDTSETAWDRTKEMLTKGHEEFENAVSKLDDSKLDQPIVAGLASVYVTLHGIIQHTLYHAGQIAILKKALGEN